MKWEKMTGIVKDAAGNEIVNPIDGSEGTWYPDDTDMNHQTVKFRSGGWWSVAAHRDQFGT